MSVITTSTSQLHFRVSIGFLKEMMRTFDGSLSEVLFSAASVTNIQDLTPTRVCQSRVSVRPERLQSCGGLITALTNIDVR